MVQINNKLKCLTNTKNDHSGNYVELQDKHMIKSQQKVTQLMSLKYVYREARVIKKIISIFLTYPSIYG